MGNSEQQEAEKPPKGVRESVSPPSGLFGFAGTTQFQPGQGKFKPDENALPFQPDGNGK